MANRAVLQEVEAMRARLLQLTHCDIFRNALFVEYLACALFGLHHVEGATSRVDAITDVGTLVEIKYASWGTVTQRWPDQSAVVFRRLTFQRLQGSARGGKPVPGKPVDVYLLVGVDRDQLEFYVVPAAAIGRQKEIAISMGLHEKDRPRQSQKWGKYCVTFDDVPREIDARGRPDTAE